MGPHRTAGFIDASIDQTEAVGAAAVHAPTAPVNASRVRRAKSVVFVVDARTVGNRETAAAMRAAVVDDLIANSPEYVYALRRSRAFGRSLP